MLGIAINVALVNLFDYTSLMQNTDTFKNPFTGLARWGQAGGWRWHVAALGAGWLTFVARPPLASRPVTTIKHVVIAAALLLTGLMFIGHLLAALQPVFVALGHLDVIEIVLGLFALVNLRLYFVGAKVLSALGSAAAQAGSRL